MKYLPLLVSLVFAPVLGAAESAPVAVPGKAAEPNREELEKPSGVEPKPPEGEDLNIHIELLMVDVPDAEALKLVPQLRDARQIDQAYATLLDMIATKRASLVAWPMVVTKSGNRAVSENVDEVIYPVGFAPGGVVLNPTPHNPTEPRPAPSTPNAPVDPLQVSGTIASDPIPSNYQTRNAGQTLEIEPNISGDRVHIEAQLAPQHVYFAGMVKHTIDKDGHKITVEQPRFLVNKVSTNITTRSGQRLLLGTFRSLEQPDSTELFLYQATIRPAAK